MNNCATIALFTQDYLLHPLVENKRKQTQTTEKMKASSHARGRDSWLCQYQLYSILLSLDTSLHNTAILTSANEIECSRPLAKW